MKIVILSRNAALYSTRRLAQAARLRGHHVQIIDTLSVQVNVPQSRQNRSCALPEADAIIPRIGTSITYYGLAVVRQFEARGVLTTATADAIARSRDKLHSLQIMNLSGLPIPSTAVVGEPSELWPAIRVAGGLPVIIKLIRGTQGRGVFLASHELVVEAILKTVHRLKEQMLIQEFIQESAGTDIRVIVVGNRCVAAMKRTANAGEFRSNLHRGGYATSISPDQETRQLAVKAAHAHGLSVAGVDILQSDRGPLLLEVNSSPGLEGIEKSTRIDVASEIVRFLEGAEKKKRHHERTRKRSG